MYALSSAANTLFVFSTVADVAQSVENMMRLLLAMHLPSSIVNPRDLVEAAAQGNVDKVRDIVSRFPDQVNDYRCALNSIKFCEL